MPNADEFRCALNSVLAKAQASGKADISIVSGDLHRQVGGYPGPNHRMPVCCKVMREAMKDGDEIVSAPPRGQGATLSVRYKLPR